MDEAAILALDRESVLVWPCLSEDRLGEWKLRFGGGLYGRSNSVQPHGEPGCGLEEAIDRCEARYAFERIVPTFRLPEISSLANLDGLLASRGYVVEDSTLVQVAHFGLDRGSQMAWNASRHPPGNAPGGDTDRGLSADIAPNLELATDLGPEWLAAYCDLNHRAPGREAIVSAIWHRLPPPRRFALIRDGVGVVCIGAASIYTETVWVFGMVTRESHRRQGLGAAVLGSILAWGSKEGARRAALQVVDDNVPAVALYAKFGFQTGYRYHYRRPRLNRTSGRR